MGTPYENKQRWLLDTKEFHLFVAKFINTET